MQPLENILSKYSGQSDGILMPGDNMFPECVDKLYKIGLKLNVISFNYICTSHNMTDDEKVVLNQYGLYLSKIEL